MPIKTFTMAAGRATARLGGVCALVLPALLITIAPADAGSANVSCLGSGPSVNCAAQWNGGGGGFPLVIEVPPPDTDREQAASAGRDRKWREYCQPTVRYDRYGVGRYVYRVAGCEFGRLED